MIVTRKLYTYVTRDVGPVGTRKIVKTDCGPVKQIVTQQDVLDLAGTVVWGIWEACGRPSSNDPGGIIGMFQERVQSLDLE